MTDLDGSPSARSEPRLSSVALCLVAATLLAASGLSQRWLANGAGADSIRYGIIRYTECVEGRCVTSNNDVTPEALRKRHPPEELHPAFALAGWTTAGASALAIAGLFVCAVIGLFRRRVALPIAPSSLALFGLLIAMIGGALFIATKPGGIGRVGIDWSFIVFSVAIVIGMGAAQRISKEIRPIDPELEALERMMSGR
jgi:hypothetical protein